MVLIRALCALAGLAGGVGCGQSLFDAHGDHPDGGGPGDGDGGGDGPDVPKTCPDTCLADAAADFDKPPGPWRYLEEGPDHRWLPMPLTGSERIGMASGDNKIRRCADEPSASACRALPDALLVRSAGGSSAFFPALEFRAPSAQVLHLIIRAHVPGDSGEQDIRLYRNGREDALFTAPGVKGATVEREVIVDALPGDRFLAAVEPAGSAGGSAALQVFVSQRGESFPSTCQLAASFKGADANNMLEDLCTNRELTSLMGMEIPVPPAFIQGPFDEQGTAIDLTSGRYLRGPNTAPLDRLNTPVTIQLWFYANSVVSPGATLFEDLDPDLGGGLNMILLQPAAPRLEVSGYSSTNPQTTASASGPITLGKWHFLRVIDKNDGAVTVCVDGDRLGSFDLPANRPMTPYPVQLGKAIVAGMTASFDGAIDDVRVFSTALPCP